MMSDSECLRRYAEAGDQTAFAELVQRQLNLVYRAAWRQLGGDAHRAEDAAQIVFTLLARKAGTLKTHPALSGWLYATTRNVVRDLRREELRRYLREKEAIMNPEETSDPLDLDRLRAGLDDAMAELKREDHEVLFMRFFQERSFNQVGSALRLTEDAARMRVARALEKLRGVLMRRGVSSTAAALGTVLASESAIAAPTGLAATVTAVAVSSESLTAGIGLLAFMSSTKLVTATAIAMALGCGAAVYEASRANEAREALVTAQREYLNASTGLLNLQSRSSGLRGTVIAAQNVAEARRSAQPVGDAERAALDAGQRYAAEHPEFEEILRKAPKALIRGQYFLLYRELGLSSQQIEAFERIHLDALSPVKTLLPDGGPGMMWTLGEGVSGREMSNRLYALLGRDGYEKYMSGLWSNAGSPTAELAAALCTTETPLSVEQATSLRRLIFEERTGAPGVPRARSAEFWGRIRERASGFLSDPQIAALGVLEARDTFFETQERAVRR